MKNTAKVVRKLLSQNAEPRVNPMYENRVDKKDQNHPQEITVQMVNINMVSKVIL